MNILIINHYAGSPVYGMEFRPFYLGREWVRSGHNVTVIGASFSHLRKQQPEVDTEYLDGIKYVWLKTPVYNGNGIGRVFNIIVFLWRLFCQYTDILGGCNPDLVIASSTYPLDNYLAYHIAKKYKARYVFELHDLWPLSPMLLGNISPYHPFIMVMQAAETFTCRHADKVISVLPNAEMHLMEHGLKHGKFVCIPNGIVIEEWQCRNHLPAEHNDFLQKLHEDGKFIIGYAGGITEGDALEYLLQAVNQLKNKKDISIVIVGKGNRKIFLQNMCSELCLENVFFLPPVLKQEVPALLEKFDALYIGWLNKPLYKYGISPNKLAEYMMSSKPIIHSVTAGNDLVTEAKCGISVPAEDVSAISKAILQMSSLSLGEREDMGKRGHDYIINNYDYVLLAKKFLEVCYN